MVGRLARDGFKAVVNLRTAQEPALVHCASGKRAGSFSVMPAAAEEGLSGDSALKKAKDLGFEWNNAPEFGAFVRQCLEGHR